MTPLETYLTELRDLRSTGATVRETSFYGPLAVFLNTLGEPLKPRVRCVVNIANIGAGIPDVGLFTQDQFQNRSALDPLPGQPPARGVVEVKGISANVETIAGSEQVARYLNRYNVVLVTNYRDFLLVSRDPAGRDVWRERYTLAATESDFWSELRQPVAFARKHRVPLEELLKRVLLHNAPISQPRDIAWFLASYARDAKDRVENTPLDEMDAIREAIEQVLGIRFHDEKSQHFFRSTLVQTLFYGVFSAFVLWHRQHLPVWSGDRFDWKTAAFSLQVPIISALFHQIANPLRLQPLGLDKILDWTAGALNRVDRARFFSQFDEGDAVQYFYEPFLEAFDPELRIELGVWYTPREIVRYQVERVDRALRSELGIADGLADPSVYVLDPCCGTGAYLVEVLHRVERTLREKGDEAFVASDLKQAAIERIIGFEILSAPFVVAHLQIGMLLKKYGSELAPNERAAIFLSNALTGWEPASEEVKSRLRQLELHFPDFRKERDAADSVKRSKRILVVLGNPPYNAFAGTSPEEEEGLVEPYKGAYRDDNKRRRYRLNDAVESGGWGIKKFNLDDLYIRFFRIAERCITEGGGAGVISYISNFSYLSEPSYVVMRSRLIAEFDRIWVDCLNGDSRETGKVTPDGKPDPSAFSTEFNREGIRKGTAVCVLVRGKKRKRSPGRVFYRDFWGVDKRKELESTLTLPEIQKPYIQASPTLLNRRSFRPENVTSSYLAWPRLSDLAEVYLNGLMEKRGGALIDIERPSLERRMRAYYDPKIDWSTWKARGDGLTRDAGRFPAEGTRKKALQMEAFSEGNLVRYSIRPLDTQWCYYTRVRPIWNEPRPALYKQFKRGNKFLISRTKGVASPEGVPVSFCTALGDDHYLRVDANYLPFVLHNGKQEAESSKQVGLYGSEEENFNPGSRANLSLKARAYLQRLGVSDPDTNPESAALLWEHSLAIGFSPRYLVSNKDGVRGDWPRIPLPASKEVLLESAALGRTVGALLDTEYPVQGVTTGVIREELRTVGQLAKKKPSGDFGAQISSLEDLAITSGWARLQGEGVVMPGPGRTDKRAANDPWTSVIDVYLNENVCWRNVPIDAWEFYIGGFQVLKKWLSYREHGTAEKAILGRPITKEEARYFQEMARRLAALILLQQRLNQNYDVAAANAYHWPSAS